MRPPAMLATTDNVIEWSPWNLRKVQGQITNCETSVVTHSFFDLTHQIIIHQRWTSTSRLIVHVLSPFVEYPEPCPQATAQRSSLCGSLSAWTLCPLVSILRSFDGWLPWVGERTNRWSRRHWSQWQRSPGGDLCVCGSCRKHRD